MTLTLHTIKPQKGARTKSFRIGRGNASGRGTTAGKGTKGQRARTGGRKGLKLKGMKQMLLQIPKLRGFKSRYPKVATVTLANLAMRFTAGEKIDLRALKSKRLVPNTFTAAKIVGAEKILTALTLSGLAVSRSAKAAIEKAGGSVHKKAS
ncbi:MAG: 50S ribosomal protein L15 [Patescibacteria group bacterium]